LATHFWFSLHSLVTGAFHSSSIIFSISVYYAFYIFYGSRSTRAARDSRDFNSQPERSARHDCGACCRLLFAYGVGFESDERRRMWRTVAGPFFNYIGRGDACRIERLHAHRWLTDPNDSIWRFCCEKRFESREMKENNGECGKGWVFFGEDEKECGR